MGSSDTPPAQRARTKTPDFSELFRTTNASRHASRPAAGATSSSSSTPWEAEKPVVAKTSGRRSMLPFLGRKKHVEQPPVPATPSSRKSVGNPAHPVTPVNTVRRSFGNGHAVFMITPPTNPPIRLPEPPLPSKLPSTDVHPPSLGSKLAAHFTPLRSPSRTSKARLSMIQNATIPAIPPMPTALSSLVPEIRAPSMDSQYSTCSRSTTPRPFRGPHSTIALSGDEEDFSDLFTLPDQLKKPTQSPNFPSATSVQIPPGDSPRESGEITPTTPVTPSGPSLQFPIPPPMGIHRSILTDKGYPSYSSERASLSSQGSKKSPSRRLSRGAADGSSGRTLPSQDEQRSGHHRTISISGSDTDTSRVNDSTYSVPSFKFSDVFPRVPERKHKLSQSSITKASSGPPPSVPLPSPPVSPNPSPLLGPRASASPDRVVFRRPRASTLSVTSNLAVPGSSIPKSNHSSPTLSSRVNSEAAPVLIIEELQGALAQQRRKNAQLQEYIGTITKRYEDDRTAMTKSIEKLERNIRKKMREIEGLRWLVIHNGAVSDIDAAANLARSSLSTQDGDASDSVQRTLPLLSSPVVPPHRDGSQKSMPKQKYAGIAATATTSVPEISSDASISALSLSTSSVSDTTSLTTPSISVASERIDWITRAERQRLKEERRASKALRRISATSIFTLGTEPLTQSSSPDSPLDPLFEPNQSMDEVMEKLQPFRHA